MTVTATMPETENRGRNLASETVCISVTFGLLGNSRKVATSAVEIDADKTLIKVQKTLLDSKELDSIRKADGELRRYLYDICLPFDVGIYLLPIGLIQTVDRRLLEYRTQRETLVEDFLAAYNDLCRDAATRLRTLYNPRDYPAASAVKDKFSFDWRYISFGTPDALKAISDEMFESERLKAEQRMEQAADEVTAVMRATLAELVSHLRDRLTPSSDGKQKILRDSAVTNILDFLKTFDLRNVTGDAALAELAQQCRRILQPIGRDVDIIRNVDSIRSGIRADMTAIASQLDSLVQEKPSRKFRFED